MRVVALSLPRIPQPSIVGKREMHGAPSELSERAGSRRPTLRRQTP